MKVSNLVPRVNPTPYGGLSGGRVGENPGNEVGKSMPSFTKHVPTKHGSSKIIIRKQTKNNENKLKTLKKLDLSLNKSNS